MVKDFPESPLERVIRKAGADRVSSSAIKETLNILLEMTDKISSEAIAAARHAKRVTVKREDIVLVTRKERLGK
jgi:histone H3/H4